MQVLDSDVQLDIRYATPNNFVNEVLYPCGRCILREQVAKALESVHASLREQGFGIKVFDCYRPLPVQQKLWNKVPDARYVTPPAKGSMHNRGAAVDLTLTDAKGNPLDMGTGYDFFGEEAYHTYTDLPEEVLQMRALLRKEMEEQGFKHIRTEWWHYSFQEQQYDLADFLWPCDGI
ncbi:MAG: M15 family metallopeptidase [Saprospiraceae bacterium]|nr:M15 family metallopeptidase [Saprospiraceae bacterium]